MPLKINLKPFEKIIINQVVISNGPDKAQLIIHNQAHILRKKDILLEEELDSLSKKIYFVVQLMYLFPQNLSYHQTDFNILMQELKKAYPAIDSILVAVQQDVAQNQYYNALQKCKELIAFETRKTNDPTQQPIVEGLSSQHEYGREPSPN